MIQLKSEFNDTTLRKLIFVYKFKIMIFIKHFTLMILTVLTINYEIQFVRSLACLISYKEYTNEYLY
jgi:hypothetical protein